MMGREKGRPSFPPPPLFLLIVHTALARQVSEGQGKGGNY